MTFEEFRYIAMNPPKRDIETIFEIIEYDVRDLPEHRRNHYPKFGVYHFRVGFGRTLTEAETIIKDAVDEAGKQNREVYCFHIMEFPLGEYIDSGTFWIDYGIEWRLYDASGRFLDKTYCSELTRDQYTRFGRFCGRSEESFRFKSGDIVEVLYGDEVRLAVIDGTSSTLEKLWSNRKSKGSIDKNMELVDEEVAYLDASDDVIWIIFGPNYFDYDDDWVHILNIMPLRYPLSKKLRDRFKGYYNAMMKERNET